MRYFLLFFLPTQLGTFFFFDFSYVNGIRMDYLAPAIYFTDILFFICLLVNLKVLRPLVSKKTAIFSSLLLLNIIFSTSPWIGLYKSLKLFEIVILFYLFASGKLNNKFVLLSLIWASAIQLFLGISQVISGHALQGIWYFLGERAFTLGTPGIAKVALQSVETLRAYGTFSHPNSMAGCYVLLYAFVLFDKRFKKYIKLKYLFLCLSTLIVLITFSKIAIITFLLINTFYLFIQKKDGCLICNISKIAVLVIVAGIFLMSHGDTDTINKRVFLTNSAFTIIQQHPLTGVGLGNYLRAQEKFANPYPYHFLEPVHNIFLLLLAELGIILSGLIVYLLIPLVKSLWKSDTGKAVLLVILITGLFDHYWLTLQQNIFLMPVIFGLLQKDEDVIK